MKLLDSGAGRYVVLTEDRYLKTKRLAYQGQDYEDAKVITNRLDERQNTWLFDLHRLSLRDNIELRFFAAEKHLEEQVETITEPTGFEAFLTLKRLSGSL